MKKNIFISLFLISKYIIACNCPQLMPVEKKIIQDYNVIFWGKVTTVSSCKSNGIATASFTIIELYKGVVEQDVKVEFDCESSCLMSFAKGEEWLMYLNFQQFDKMTANICQHSRKKFGDQIQDIYQISSGRTFEQEKQLLQTTLGIQKFGKKNKLNELQAFFKPHNEQPSGNSKLLLLFISLIVMAVIIYVSKRRKKE